MDFTLRPIQPDFAAEIDGINLSKPLDDAMVRAICISRRTPRASAAGRWPMADGRLLLMDLNAHATNEKFVYSHTWRTGDLAYGRYRGLG